MPTHNDLLTIILPALLLLFLSGAGYAQWRVNKLQQEINGIVQEQIKHLDAAITDLRSKMTDL